MSAFLVSLMRWIRIIVLLACPLRSYHMQVEISPYYAEHSSEMNDHGETHISHALAANVSPQEP